MARNDHVRVNLDPYVNEKKAKKEATKMEKVFKTVFDKPRKFVMKNVKGMIREGVGMGKTALMGGASSILSLLRAYLDKFKEIRDVIEQMSGSFGSDLDLANSLNTNVENLMQLRLAYQKLGVSQEMVSSSLEKFQQLVANQELELVGDQDMLAGYLNFMKQLEGMDKTSQDEWLLKLGGRNLSANRKIMGANSQIDQVMKEVRTEHGQTILRASQAGHGLDTTFAQMGYDQMVHDLENMHTLYEKNITGDLLKTDALLREKQRALMKQYSGEEGSNTSLVSGQLRENAISGMGASIGEAFFSTVERLMSAEWATNKGGIFGPLNAMSENIGTIAGILRDGVKPIGAELSKIADSMKKTSSHQEQVEKAQATANQSGVL